MTDVQKYEAIEALYQGNYNNEQLLKIGQLDTDFKTNVARVINYPNRY